MQIKMKGSRGDKAPTWNSGADIFSRDLQRVTEPWKWKRTPGHRKATFAPILDIDIQEEQPEASSILRGWALVKRPRGSSPTLDGVVGLKSKLCGQSPKKKKDRRPERA